MSSEPSPGLHFHRRKDDAPLVDGTVAAPDANREPPPKNGEDKSETMCAQRDGRDQKSVEGKETEGNADKDKAKDGEHPPMSPFKKRILIVVGIVVAVAVITFGILYWLHARHFETTDDAFIDGHVSQISPQASGRIQTLLVEDNEQVQAGQLLAEIDPRDYQVKLDQADAERAQAVAQRDLQHANVSQALANVAVAEADVYQADQDLKRFRAVDPKAITRQQLDNAIASDRSANAKLESNREAVGAARAQEASAEANLQQSDVAVANARLQLSYTKITSPIAGRVTRRTVEVGNVVAEGTPLLAVVSTDLWVTANYKETQLDLMRIGQAVQIRIDAFPDAKFNGHIDSFQKGSGSVFSTLPAENATGNFVKVVQRVPVKIVFDDPTQRDKYPLAPGLSVDPRVTVR